MIATFMLHQLVCQKIISVLPIPSDIIQLDTAKARLQALPTSPSETSRSPSWKEANGTYNVLRNMARSEGVASWYRGFGAVMVGGTPGTILYLCR